MGKTLKYVKDFEFPSDKGYSASSGQTMVKGYARGGSCGMAKGGNASAKMDRLKGVIGNERKEITRVEAKQRDAGQELSRVRSEMRYDKNEMKGMRKQYPTNRSEPMIAMKKGGHVSKKIMKKFDGGYIQDPASSGVPQGVSPLTQIANPQAQPALQNMIPPGNTSLSPTAMKRGGKVGAKLVKMANGGALPPGAAGGALPPGVQDNSPDPQTAIDRKYVKPVPPQVSPQQNPRMEAVRQKLADAQRGANEISARLQQQRAELEARQAARRAASSSPRPQPLPQRPMPEPPRPPVQNVDPRRPVLPPRPSTQPRPPVPPDLQTPMPRPGGTFQADMGRPDMPGRPLAPGATPRPPIKFANKAAYDQYMQQATGAGRQGLGSAPMGRPEMTGPKNIMRPPSSVNTTMQSDVMAPKHVMRPPSSVNTTTQSDMMGRNQRPAGGFNPANMQQGLQQLAARNNPQQMGRPAMAKGGMLYSKKEVSAKNLLGEGKAPPLPHARGSVNMAKGGAAGKVGKVMGEFKAGELHSGKNGPVVKSRKQAIAIGLSEARRAKK